MELKEKRKKVFNFVLLSNTTIVFDENKRTTKKEIEVRTFRPNIDFYDKKFGKQILIEKIPFKMNKSILETRIEEMLKLTKDYESE